MIVIDVTCDTKERIKAWKVTDIICLYVATNNVFWNKILLFVIEMLLLNHSELVFPFKNLEICLDCLENPDDIFN